MSGFSTELGFDRESIQAMIASSKCHGEIVHIISSRDLVIRLNISINILLIFAPDRCGIKKGHSGYCQATRRRLYARVTTDNVRHSGNISFTLVLVPLCSSLNEHQTARRKSVLAYYYSDNPLKTLSDVGFERANNT